MAITLCDTRQLSDETLQAFRLRALHAIEQGYTEATVADILGIARETVSRWWRAYAEQGPDALPGERSGRPVGSGRTLNDGQEARFRVLINEHSPQELGIAAPLWTRGPSPRDSPGIRDRHAGSDRRLVPQALGLYRQGAPAARQGPRSR